MKNLFENKIGCDLMVWETNPNKRNQNNEVKFVVDSKQDVSVGDIVVGDYSQGVLSSYELTNIKDRRPASIKGKDYITCDTNWSNKKINFSDFNLFVSTTFKTFFSIR